MTEQCFDVWIDYKLEGSKVGVLRKGSVRDVVFLSPEMFKLYEDKETKFSFIDSLLVLLPNGKRVPFMELGKFKLRRNRK